MWNDSGALAAALHDDINVGGTFCYLRLISNGYSRFIVHWEIRDVDVPMLVRPERLDEHPEGQPTIAIDLFLS